MDIFFILMSIVSMVFVTVHFFQLVDSQIEVIKSFAPFLLYVFVLFFSLIGIYFVNTYPTFDTHVFKDYITYDILESKIVGNTETLTRKITNNCLLTTKHNSVFKADNFDDSVIDIKKMTCEEYKKSLGGKTKK